MAQNNKFTEEEAKIVDRYFTNRYKNVFGLKNLPDSVKAALFARYSRTHKPLRRLFLDEFYTPSMPDVEDAKPNARTKAFFEKVLGEYGDDSVMQLGSASIAVENASILAAKELQRSRLAGYLEKSTRYLDYTKPEHFQCVTGPSYARSGRLKQVQKTLYDAYCRGKHRWHSKDDLRGLLPVSLTTSFGIHANAQTLERMITRGRAFYQFGEVLELTSGISTAAQKLLPELMTRTVNLNNYSFMHNNINYYRGRKQAMRYAAPMTNDKLTPFVTSPNVKLISFGGDPMLFNILLPYKYSKSSAENIQNHLGNVYNGELKKTYDYLIRHALLKDRDNRRHLPERMLESVNATFEIVSDYATYRDLQRHRMLAIEAQEFGANLGYHTPTAILADNHMNKEWDKAMLEALQVYKHYDTYNSTAYMKQYALPMAYNIRYVIHANLRELIHLIELRSKPGGHSTYREIARLMYQQLKHACSENLKLDFDLKFFGGNDEL